MRRCTVGEGGAARTTLVSQPEVGAPAFIRFSVACSRFTHLERSALVEVAQTRSYATSFSALHAVTLY